MKTYHIKDLLKKELLIIEWQDDYEIVGRIIFGKSNQKGVLENLFNLDGYTILGKLDEIREDDARELVEKVMNCQHFQNYKGRKENDFANLWCKNATESLLSAIESEIYWENPIPPFAKQGEEISVTYAKWYEAESRTFDRNRSIILVKN